MSILHLSGEHVAFRCPGCNEAHRIRIVANSHPAWTWNGDSENPTFTPSILVTSGHYVPYRPTEACWCTYNLEHPEDPAPFKCERCHSFVINGNIQFLTDCTHKLAGQTVRIPEWDY